MIIICTISWHVLYDYLKNRWYFCNPRSPLLYFWQCSWFDSNLFFWNGLFQIFFDPVTLHCCILLPATLLAPHSIQGLCGLETKNLQYQVGPSSTACFLLSSWGKCLLSWLVTGPEPFISPISGVTQFPSFSTANWNFSSSTANFAVSWAKYSSLLPLLFLLQHMKPDFSFYLVPCWVILVAGHLVTLWVLYQSFPPF